MPSQRAHTQLLILNVPRSRKTSRWPRTLSIVLPLLKLLRFRFATVSEALEAPAGKFACLTIDSAERGILTSIAPSLEARQIPATLFIDTKSISQRSANKLAGRSTTRLAHIPLDWKALKGLALKGWEIGSLGHEQVNLTEKSYLEQKLHIAKSRELIARHLGEDPKSFAYPFGAYDATTLSCVRDSGFSAAVTMRPQSIIGNHETADMVSRYQLPRLNLTGHLLRDLVAVLRQLWRARSQTQTVPQLQSAMTTEQVAAPLNPILSPIRPDAKSRVN